MTTITAAATTPVTGVNATSPAYSGTFIPTLWSGKLNAKFYAASTFADVCNTDWQGEISNMGDKVIINNIPTLTINQYSIGSNLEYEVPTPSTLELAIDQGYYFGVGVSDVLEYQAKPNLMDMFTNDAAQQLKIKIERECWRGTFDQGSADNKDTTAGVISGAYNLGNDTTPITLTAANILQKILEMASVLDEQNVPDTDRWLVITPRERTLLMQSNLAQAQFMGDNSSIVRNGKIGMIDRFTVYVSNLLPVGAAGSEWTQVNGTTATSGGTAARHAVIAGHKTAITFASQINKVEPLRNPTDFGDLVRGLNIYGRKVVKADSLCLMVAAG